MDNFERAVLYAYPLLKNVEEDYQAHISNMAILSYRKDVTAEKWAERIAEEIICKRKLLWIKGVVERCLQKLTERERFLIAVRYFGKRKKTTDCVGGTGFSESTYFRQQKRVIKKMRSLFWGEGLSSSVFVTEYKNMELFEKIARFLERGGEHRLEMKERAWLEKQKTGVTE